MPQADLYVFSAPTEAFNIQKNIKKFMKNLKGIRDKKYIIINTHAMKNKNSLRKMEKILTKKQMIKVASVNFQVGDVFKNGNGFHGYWEMKLDEFIKKL